jgi:hypothetical protein
VNICGVCRHSDLRGSGGDICCCLSCKAGSLTFFPDVAKSDASEWRERAPLKTKLLREVDFGFGFDDEEGVGVGVAGVAEFLAGFVEGIG